MGFELTVDVTTKRSKRRQTVGCVEVGPGLTNRVGKLPSRFMRLARSFAITAQPSKLLLPPQAVVFVSLHQLIWFENYQRRASSRASNAKSAASSSSVNQFIPGTYA